VAVRRADCEFVTAYFGVGVVGPKLTAAYFLASLLTRLRIFDVFPNGAVATLIRVALATGKAAER
jgi:hypothetical protein